MFEANEDFKNSLFSKLKKTSWLKNPIGEKAKLKILNIT